MNKLIPLIAIGGLVGLVACDEVVDTDPTDSTGLVDCGDEGFPSTGALSAGDYTGCNPYVGSATISYFPPPTCGGSGWEYYMEMKGIAGGVTYYNYDDGGGFPWSEEHDLTDGETDPNGFWDAFSIALPIVDDFNNQIDSTNTLHTCASNNGSTLVWGVEAYEYQDGGGAGPAIDCIIVSESEATDAWVDDMKGEFSNLAGCDVIEGWTAE